MLHISFGSEHNVQLNGALIYSADTARAAYLGRNLPCHFIYEGLGVLARKEGGILGCGMYVHLYVSALKII